MTAKAAGDDQGGVTAEHARLIAANAALEARAQVLAEQLDIANRRIDALVEHLAENRAPLGPIG